MSIASSWLDIAVGIDFHIEIVPAPTPTPFPNPHCSVIWDPIGYVIGEVTGVAFAAIVGAPIEPAGPVLVGGSMGTVTGDAAAMPIKYILGTCRRCGTSARSIEARGDPSWSRRPRD